MRSAVVEVGLSAESPVGAPAGVGGIGAGGVGDVGGVELQPVGPTLPVRWG